MPRNRLPRAMKNYSSTGGRKHGRRLKRLLDTWDRNGPTSGPTPWQIYEDHEVKQHLFFWNIRKFYLIPQTSSAIRRQSAFFPLPGHQNLHKRYFSQTE
jgi:hypothetical protein